MSKALFKAMVRSNRVKPLAAFFLFILGMLIFTYGINKSVSHSEIQYTGITGRALSTDLLGVPSSLTLFILGIFLMLGAASILTFSIEEKRREKQCSIDEIVSECEKRNITPKQAAEKIDAEIGGIYFIRYKAGKQHSVYGGRYAFNIYLKNREIGKELALSEYIIAKNKHPELANRNELHIGEYASTKHHRNGFEELVNKYEKSKDKQNK